MESDAETIAAQMRALEQEATESRSTADNVAAQEVDRLLNGIHTQLVALKGERAGGVRIYCKQVRGTDARLTALKVHIGTEPVWLSRPILSCSITVSPGASGMPFLQNIRIDYPREDADPLLAELNAAISKYEKVTPTPPELADRVRVLAAVCINLKPSHSWSPPLWYLTIGGAIGALLAVAVYLLCAFSGGLWGIFLGWIPALIAWVTARYLWLPAAALAAYAALRP